MYSLFSYLDKVKSIKNVSETVIVEASECKYTFEYNLSGKDKSLLQIPEDFFYAQNVKIDIESSEKKNTNDFLSPFLEDDLDELTVSIIFNYEIIDGSWNLFFYDEKSFIEFLKSFLSFNHSILLDLKTKILIYTFKKINFDIKSTILNVKELLSNEVSNPIPLEDNTINFIKNTIHKEMMIGSIPGAIISNKDIQDRVYSYKSTITSYLNLLSNTNNSNHYHFYGKKLVEITLDNTISLKKAKNICEDLMETIDFIFKDLKTADQKLTFYRKVFTEYNITKENLVISDDIPQDFFKEILTQTQYIYDTYIDGEISAYIKEKKDIVKEYLSISKEIIQTTNDFKNNIIKNLITIFALFITNFLLKLNELSSTKIFFVAIFIFLIILILITLFHDREQLDNYYNRVKTLQSYFKFISKESKDLQQDTEILLRRELGVLKFITYFQLFVYCVFLLICLVTIISF